MKDKQFTTIEQAIKAKEQRIRMIGNEYSRSRKKTYGATNVEESRCHGNLKDFTAWKRAKTEKE
jgi:hypothetical protein